MYLVIAYILTLNWILRNGSILFLVIWRNTERLMKSVRLQKHTSIPSGSLETLIYALLKGKTSRNLYIFR